MRVIDRRTPAVDAVAASCAADADGVHAVVEHATVHADDVQAWNRVFLRRERAETTVDADASHRGVAANLVTVHVVRGVLKGRKELGRLGEIVIGALRAVGVVLLNGGCQRGGVDAHEVAQSLDLVGLEDGIGIELPQLFEGGFDCCVVADERIERCLVEDLVMVFVIFSRGKRSFDLGERGRLVDEALSVLVDPDRGSCE